MSPKPRWELARNKNRDFTFELPKGWEDQTAYTFRGPTMGEVEHLLMLYLDRTGRHQAVRDLAQEHIDPIVKNVQGLEVLKDQEVTLDDGNPCYEFVAKWVPGDGVVILKRYVFVLAEDLGFAFVCDFSKKSFQELAGQMDDIIESLVPGTFEPTPEDPWAR